MATIEQMAALSMPFKTSQGAEYLLPPLNIFTRRKALEFVDLAKQAQEAGGTESEQAEKLLDGLVDLVHTWCLRVRPELTVEQIEQDWDIADCPKLMAIINGIEQEARIAVPPASSAPRKRATNRK